MGEKRLSFRGEGWEYDKEIKTRGVKLGYLDPAQLRWQLRN